MIKFALATWLTWVVIGIGAHCVADEVAGVDDRRIGQLRDLNGYFPFKPVQDKADWEIRQTEIRRRILVSQGLWPLPAKSALNAVIHGRVERDDYVVDRVYFESLPGHYVTGNLYRPKSVDGPIPAILSPHGHWQEGRFYDAGADDVEQQIASGAESFAVGGRFPIQARAVQLARMGCLVFVYDMTGYADSVQLPHRSAHWKHLDRRRDWGFMSVQADLRLQNTMGLQTWNSIRAIDFMVALEHTDPARIGVTGASGGGTQSMILAAIDQRIAAAMPCVMVSTAMQGGCSCENAPLLRIDQGNVDIAAAIAPRPLGLAAADDWTVELKTKGFPDLVELYEMLGHRERLMGIFRTEFKHNYNQINRMAMYEFFNRHFELGLESPIHERDYQPLTIEQATVWNGDHPKPSGNQIGEVHEVRLLRQATAESDQQLKQLVPSSTDQLAMFRTVVGGGWQTILGRPYESIGDVELIQQASRVVGPSVVTNGHIVSEARKERVSVVIHAPKTNSNKVVVRVSDLGKTPAGRERADREINSSVERGWTVITADLFGQGVVLPDGEPLNGQRWGSKNSGDTWRDFSGYTYGYNHSLFALRVHDVLSLIKYARSQSDVVHVHGSGTMAGPVAAAASSQATHVISGVRIDPNRFTFDSIDRHDHPMFVPGSKKYFGIDGLLALVAPMELTIVGDTEFPVTRDAYRAANHSDRLQFVKRAHQD